MPLIDFSSADLPGSGDLNPGGGGMTTSSRTNATVLQAYNTSSLSTASTVVAPGAVGTAAGHVIPWWIAIVVALIVWGIFDAKGEKADLKEVKVGFANSFKVTLFVIAWLTLLKWVFGIYVIPGASAIVEAV